MNNNDHVFMLNLDLFWNSCYKNAWTKLAGIRGIYTYFEIHVKFYIKMYSNDQNLHFNKVHVEVCIEPSMWCAIAYTVRPRVLMVWDFKEYKRS